MRNVRVYNVLHLSRRVNLRTANGDHRAALACHVMDAQRPIITLVSGVNMSVSTAGARTCSRRNLQVQVARTSAAGPALDAAPRPRAANRILYGVRRGRTASVPVGVVTSRRFVTLQVAKSTTRIHRHGVQVS